MKKRFSLALLVAGAMAATAILFGAGPAAAATTWNVYCPGDDLQNTINNLANPGDTIVIYGTCYGNFEIQSVLISQVTLQGGSSGATLNGRGTGITLDIEGGLATIRNLTITNGNSTSGGGLYMVDAGVTVVNSTVKGNRADFGGGIYSQVGSFLDLTGVTVTRNTARYQGGGLYLQDSAVSMTASTVSLNRTTEVADFYGGGGIWMANSDVLLTSTRVTSNSSADYGGGIAAYGGCFRISDVGPFAASICNPILKAGGTAVFDRSLPAVIDTGLKLVSSSVDHNGAADDGGGIYNASEFGDAPVVLEGSVVSFNNAHSGDGGGIANYGVCANTASILATGSTFKGNGARNGEGGAIYNAAGEDECSEAGTGLVTIALSAVSNAPNNLNQNQAMYGGGIANVQGDGLASVSIQAKAQITGNKASVTGGGVWNNCGSLLKTGGNVLLNTPNNIVSGCWPAP